MKKITCTVALLTLSLVLSGCSLLSDKMPPATAVRASHILLKFKPLDKVATLRKMQEIRTQIINGKSFAQMARKYSDCPSGREAGGDLGWFYKGRMMKRFEDVAMTLKPGVVSQPFESRPGYYHIVLVHERR